MIISSNMLQPSLGSDLNALSLNEEKVNVNPVQPAKTEFNELFSRLFSSVAQPESKSLSVINESEGLSLPAEDISIDVRNPANEKSVEAKLIDLMQDLKKALKEKTEVMSGSADQAGMVNEAAPVVLPELLQKVDQLVNHEVRIVSTVPGKEQTELNSTPSVQLIQEAFRELKQVMVGKPAEQTSTETEQETLAVKEVIPATIPELLQRVEQLVNQEVRIANPTTVTGQGELKSTPAEQPLQTALHELKQALKRPAEQAAVETVAKPAAAKEVIPATIPELLQRVEQLVNQEVRIANPTTVTGQGELKSTPAEQPLQAALHELKQALKRPAEQAAVETVAKPAAVKEVMPAIIPELLQKLEITLSASATEKSGNSVKNLVAQIKELKSALKKNEEKIDASVAESFLTTPSTGIDKIPMVLLEQMEIMLAAAPAQKTVKEDLTDNYRVISVQPDMQSSSVAWIENILQQQQTQVVRQTPEAVKNTDTSVVSEQETAPRVRMATAVPETGSMKSVLERVPQQQAEAAKLVESTASTSGGVLDPAETKAVKIDAVSSRSANSPAEHTVERAANASKPDISAKSSEHAEYTTIATASREMASKEKFSFTDGSAQHNAGEKGGDNSANPSPVTNTAGLELAVQNQDRLQVQPQAENAKAPLREHIMNQVKESLANFEPTSRGGTVTMKLNPEELGELTINMRMENLRLKVDVVAHNQMVKDTIMQNIDTLREALSSQNITIDRFNVSTGGGQGMNQAFREGRNTAGNIPYKTHSAAPAGTEEIVSRKNVYWEPNETRLVNVRF